MYILLYRYNNNGVQQLSCRHEFLVKLSFSIAACLDEFIIILAPFNIIMAIGMTELE
jgi:hypothetical protein